MNEILDNLTDDDVVRYYKMCNEGTITSTQAIECIYSEYFKRKHLVRKENINLHKAFEEFLKERIMKDDLIKHIVYDETTDTLLFNCRYVYEIDAITLIQEAKIKQMK